MKKHGLVKKCMTFALGAALIMGMAGCGPAGSDSGSGQDANETSGTEAAREGGHCGAGGSGRGDDAFDRGCSQSGSGI